MLALSVSDGLLKWVSELVGATLFTSTLFFFGLPRPSRRRGAIGLPARVRFCPAANAPMY